MSHLCAAGDHTVSGWPWRLVLPSGEHFYFCDRVCLLGWICHVEHDAPRLPRIVNFRRRRPRSLLELADSLRATGTDGA